MDVVANAQAAAQLGNIDEVGGQTYRGGSSTRGLVTKKNSVYASYTRADTSKNTSRIPGCNDAATGCYSIQISNVSIRITGKDTNNSLKTTASAIDNCRTVAGFHNQSTVMCRKQMAETTIDQTRLFQTSPTWHLDLHHCHLR